MKGGGKDKYLDGKEKVWHAVYKAKWNTEKEKFACVKDNEENIFRIVKQIRTENQEGIKEKCIQGDNGNLSLDETSQNLAWKHYERLLKIELPWSQNLPHVDPVAGPVKFITPDDVLKSFRRMKTGKGARPLVLLQKCWKLLLKNHCRFDKNYHTWGKGFCRLEWQHHCLFI